MSRQIMFRLDDGVSAAGMAQDAGLSALSLRFIDPLGRIVGEQPVATPPVLRVEHGRSDGTMGWSAIRAPLSVSAAHPSEASDVELLEDGQFVARAAVAAFASDDVPTPSESRSFGAAGGWRLMVIAERFADPAPFFAACRQLFDFIAGERPFDEAGARWGIDAHFWPSDVAQGNFATFDPPPPPPGGEEQRLIFGDRDRARTFANAAGARDMALVLINSGKRGGAGGSGSVDPAWSTITSVSNERWEAVALHEIGHAFGLGDEYTAAGSGADEPDRLEPNICKHKQLPDRVPWRAQFTVSATPSPTAQANADLGGFSADAVGTFEGARYRATRRYRPAPNCRMRTAMAPFCPVCSRIIRDALS